MKPTDLITEVELDIIVNEVARFVLTSRIITEAICAELDLSDEVMREVSKRLNRRLS